MLIAEFNARFTEDGDASYLFQVMRKLSQLDAQMILAGEVVGWGEWPPDPDDPGITRQAAQVS